jgi:hypothetical protein
MITRQKTLKECWEEYLKKNIATIPLPRKSKKPVIKWGEFDAKSDNFKSFSEDGNIGIKLGEKSNKLMDIDLDWPESRRIAVDLLSSLPSFGRKNSRGGHRLFISTDECKTEKFLLPGVCSGMDGLPDEHALCIIELRGNGHQTMAPPSIHPCGEEVVWETENGEIPDIPELKYKGVKNRLGLIAFLSVVLRFYPGQGRRDEVHMALAGALARVGLKAQDINKINVLIAKLTGDEEAEQRAKGEAAVKRISEDEEVTGLPRLIEILGLPEECLKTFKSWLGVSSEDENSPEEHQRKMLKKYNEKHAVVKSVAGKCRVVLFTYDSQLDRSVITLQSFEDFKNAHLNKKVLLEIDEHGKYKFAKVGKWWLEHPRRREYETMGLYPKDCPKNVLNLWQGYGVEAIEGDCKLIFKHIFEVICDSNEEYYEYVIKWLVFAVQYPEKPAEVAIVLKGGKGTGKGIFANAICKIFGKHSLQISNPMHLVGNFNAHLEDTILLFADEAYWPDDKKYEGNLKRIITEPTLTIERKGIDATEVPNMLHMIMASNSDKIVPASIDERRFAVFEVSGKYQQNKDYFKALVSEINNGGLEALLFYLRGYNLDDWHPRNNVPKSAVLNEQRINSLPPEARAWFECLAQGHYPFYIKDSGRYFLPTQSFTKHVNENYRRSFISDRITADFFGKKGAQSMGFEKCDNNRPRGFWVPDLHEARKIWDEVMFPHKWDDLQKWDDNLSARIDPEPPF